MPKINQNAAETDETPDRLVVTIKDGAKRYVLDTDEMGPEDSRICRQQLGYPIESLLSNLGSDSLVGLLWLARVKSGEPNLAYSQVEAKYKTNKSLRALDFDFKTEFDGEENVDPLDDEDS